MRALLRQFRRAPGRIAASILALSLGIGAIGVFAIPSISTGTLHESAERDGLADVVMWSSDSPESLVDEISTIPGVARAEGQISRILAVPSDADADRTVTLAGLDFGRQTMDRLQLVAGRLPDGSHEIVIDEGVGLGEIGDRVELAGVEVDIVGIGDTLWWASEPTIYTDLATARSLTGVAGVNRMVITADDDDIDNLRTIGTQVRERLVQRGETFTDFPFYLPDGETPVDADIAQVSTLVGLLGFVAALVALVLLASTTNTLITERTREVAVMRALGARQRPLRRRLRRIAIGIAAAALVIGLPLGVLIANVIARMVLEKFVGVTPDVGFSVPVLAASAGGTLIGARLVAARAARRVTRLPLAEALRDRDGAPFGQRWSDRLASRLPLGGLRSRMAVRSSIHRRARTLSVVAQITVGAGALVTIAGLTASVTAYNESTRSPWNWKSLTQSAGPGLPVRADVVNDVPDAEAGVWVFGDVAGWAVDVFGMDATTTAFAPTMVEGRWFTGGTGNGRQAVVSVGFADHEDIDVGEALTIELASGFVSYEVVGLVDDGSRAIYADREVVAADMGSPGMANVVWSGEEHPTFELGVTVMQTTATEQAQTDSAGRQAIVAIFTALGAIVVGVALLAVASTMTVNLFERRHEFAALQAIGARRRQLRGLIARELFPLAVAGASLGVLAGWAGTAGIIASFEASNAVDIGHVFPVAAIPFVGAAMIIAVVLLARLAVRGVGRRTIAVTLRGAA